LKCLDEIVNITRPVQLLQRRLLDAESQLTTQETAQLDLKQENEGLRRQLTDMTTKFNQCQMKLSALENSTVSAERYHIIMRAQQELSQQGMSAAKSQKVALDSMQQEISVLSERNASLRHSYEKLEQSHKTAQVEHKLQIKELRPQLYEIGRAHV
jgi:predicted  nucleic acid-binding Zn-ribbon protein